MSKFPICPLCGDEYDPDSDEAKVHEHPEPQSDAVRDLWQESGLPYKEWVKTTADGIAWVKYQSGLGVPIEGETPRQRFIRNSQEHNRTMRASQIRAERAGDVASAVMIKSIADAWERMSQEAERQENDNRLD